MQAWRRNTRFQWTCTEGRGICFETSWHFIIIPHIPLLSGSSRAFLRLDTSSGTDLLVYLSVTKLMVFLILICDVDWEKITFSWWQLFFRLHAGVAIFLPPFPSRTCPTIAMVHVLLTLVLWLTISCPRGQPLAQSAVICAMAFRFSPCWCWWCWPLPVWIVWDRRENFLCNRMLDITWFFVRIYYFYINVLVAVRHAGFRMFSISCWV